MSAGILTYRAEVAEVAGEASAARADAAVTLQELAGFEVKSAADAEFAAELTRDVKAKWRELDERRKEVVKPLNDEVKTVNGWYKPALELLERVEAALKGKVAGYLRAAEDERRLALAAAAAAETPAAAEAALAPLATPAPAPPAGTSVRRVWRWRVVDEATVPRGLCSPDPAKIEALMRAQVEAGEPEIPGVHFFQEDVVAVRR